MISVALRVTVNCLLNFFASAQFIYTDCDEYVTPFFFAKAKMYRVTRKLNKNINKMIFVMLEEKKRREKKR